MTLLGYVRVSKERDEMISPAIQRDEITRYAERAFGRPVDSWYEDLDISGRKFAERPDLQRMLASVREGTVQAVVVYRLDRFSREPLHYYMMVFELEQAGVELHDSSEGRYYPGPDLAMIRGIRVLFAKNESVTHGRRITDSHRRLRASGNFAGGHAPYGMRRIVPGPGLEPDPEEAPWLVWMHERFGQGWSIGRIARELNERGVPTRTGKRWVRPTLLRVLQHEYPAGGRLLEGKLITGGNVRPVISEETWRRTQSLMSGNMDRFRSGRTGQGPVPTRICRCGSCGLALRVRYRGSLRSLACYARGDGACTDGVSIYAHVLERVMIERLMVKLKGLKADPPAPRSPSIDLSLIDEEIAQARTALERLALAYAEGAMGMEEYQGARQKLLERLKRAQEKRGRQTTLAADAALLAGLRVLWGDLGMIAEHPAILTAMPESERRDLWLVLVRSVTVWPVGADKPRVEVRFRW